MANWKTQLKTVYPVESALKELIKYYEAVDDVEAWTYKSYLDAYNNWTLNTSNLLEIKRAMNRIHQKEFGEWNLVKDTKEAAHFKWVMDELNWLIEHLDMWEDIRSADTKLSNAYTIRDNVNQVIRDASNVEKKMSEWLWAKTGRTLARWINKLSFWLNNTIAKLLASYFQASIDTAWRMDALEIYNWMKDLIKEYRSLVKRSEKVWSKKKIDIDYENLTKDMWAFADQIWVNLED